MLESSTSMNAARVTIIPMSQGLTPGAPLAFSTEIAVAPLMAIFLSGIPQPQVHVSGELMINPSSARSRRASCEASYPHKLQGTSSTADEAFFGAKGVMLAAQGVQYSFCLRERRSMARARNILDFVVASEAPRLFATSFRRSPLL